MAGRSGSCHSMCKFVAALAILAAGCSHRDPVTGPGSPSRAQAGSDWPRFLGPLGTGASPESGIRTDWTGGLRILWQLPVGEGYCAPVVADGRLFHFDRHGDQARLT